MITLFKILGISLFQFPWITLCSSDAIPLEGYDRNLTFFFRNFENVYSMWHFLRNNTDREVLIYKERIAVWENFLVEQLTGDRYDIGVLLEDFIVHCKFGDENCSDYFVTHPHHLFGNCFTLQVPGNVVPYMGIEDGLSVILAHNIPSSDQYNAHTKIDETKSVRVMVHEPYTIPDMVNNAIEITPGYSTSIGLVQQNIKRIDTPFNKCNGNPWFHISGKRVKETRSLCQQSCMIKYVYERCGCITLQRIGSQIMPYKTNEHILLGNVQHCLYINLSNMDDTLRRGLCESQNQKVVNKMARPCIRNCKLNCEEIKYKTTISYAKWPQDIGIGDFVEKYIIQSSNKTEYKRYWFSLNVNYDTSYPLNKKSMLNYADADRLVEEIVSEYEEYNETVHQIITNMIENTTILPTIQSNHKNLPSMQDAEIKWIQNSFYRLNVYFRERIVEVHTQVLNYPFEDLCSSIGGCLGLWVGCSVISIIEILQLLGGIGKITCEYIREKLFPSNTVMVKVDVKADSTETSHVDATSTE